jgi:hypothetical protein
MPFRPPINVLQPQQPQQQPSLSNPMAPGSFDPTSQGGRDYINQMLNLGSDSFQQMSPAGMANFRPPVNVLDGGQSIDGSQFHSVDPIGPIPFGDASVPRIPQSPVAFGDASVPRIPQGPVAFGDASVPRMPNNPYMSAPNTNPFANVQGPQREALLKAGGIPFAPGGQPTSLFFPPGPGSPTPNPNPNPNPNPAPGPTFSPQPRPGQFPGPPSTPTPISTAAANFLGAKLVNGKWVNANGQVIGLPMNDQASPTTGSYLVPGR